MVHSHSILYGLGAKPSQLFFSPPSPTCVSSIHSCFIHFTKPEVPTGYSGNRCKRNLQERLQLETPRKLLSTQSVMMKPHLKYRTGA